MIGIKATVFTTFIEVVLFTNFSLVFCFDYVSEFGDHSYDTGFRDTNDSNENILILYSTNYEVFETQIDEDFNQQINTRDIKSHLSDPTEVYYNLNGNYIIYEMIGFLYAYPLVLNRTNSLGMSSEQPLLTSVKANSHLNIDWIHDLFFWVKEKKQILVADIRQSNRMVIMANKLYDFISCLAVNPIDSFVIWVEFDGDINEYILFKSFEDGSNRYEFLQFQTYIKRIEFDYQSQRIYYLSNFELISSTYEGADRQTIVREPHSIFQFEVLNDHLFWIEYNSNQLFKSDLSDYKNSQKVLNLNQTINRFKLVDYWRQPIGLNRCLNANCSDICLPVDLAYYRCVCHTTCDDNPDIQLAFKEHHLVSTSTTTTSSTTTTNQKLETTRITSGVNTTSDEIIFDTIEQLDSLTFNQKNITKFNENPIVEYSDLDSLHNLKSEGNNSSPSTPTTTPTKPDSSDTYTVRSDDKFEDKEEKNKSFSGSDEKIEFENRDKHLLKNTDRDSKSLNVFTNTSNEMTFEKTNNASDIHSRNILINELKEYEYHFIPKSLYHPLIYGLILLTSGLFIGTILSAIAIRIYGKHKCQSIYSTNTGTTNKWDYVAFKKTEQNIYFGAKYTVKDESLY